MDSISSRNHTYVPHIRGIRIIHEGGEISIVESDYVADNRDVDDPDRLLDRVVAGGDTCNVQSNAPSNHPVHIPPVGRIPSKLWGVRTGHLLSFIAGMIWANIILYILGLVSQL